MHEPLTLLLHCGVTDPIRAPCLIVVDPSRYDYHN